MSDSLAQPIEAMSMMDHLRELRMRLVRSVLAIGISTLVLLAFYDQLKNLLTRPYTDLCLRRPDFKCDGSLFSLGPLDGFSARMRVCLYGGLVLALPIILWQIWRFKTAYHKKQNECKKQVFHSYQYFCGNVDLLCNDGSNGK